MRTLLTYSRITFVSTEFIVLLLGLVTLCFGLKPLGAQLSNLKLDGESIRWLALGPLALTVLIFRDSRALVLPSSHRADLHSWPEYEELRICGHVARGYGIAFSVLGIAMWIYHTTAVVQLIALGTALIGTACDYLSVYLAEIRVNELLSKCDKPVSR